MAQGYIRPLHVFLKDLVCIIFPVIISTITTTNTGYVMVTNTLNFNLVFYYLLSTLYTGCFKSSTWTISEELFNYLFLKLLKMLYFRKFEVESVYHMMQDNFTLYQKKIILRYFWHRYVRKPLCAKRVECRFKHKLHSVQK